MKSLFTLLLCAGLTLQAGAQLKTSVACPAIEVDLLDGKVNGMESDFTPSRIKKELPCFTSADADSARCGSTVMYKDKDLYFYTARKYVEIREKFKGKISVPVMGAARNTLFKWLGHPKIKEANWEAYQMSFGTLVVYFNKAGRVNKLQFSKLSTDHLTLCE